MVLGSHWARMYFEVTVCRVSTREMTRRFMPTTHPLCSAVCRGPTGYKQVGGKACIQSQQQFLYAVCFPANKTNYKRKQGDFFSPNKASFFLLANPVRDNEGYKGVRAHHTVPRRFVLIAPAILQPLDNALLVLHQVAAHFLQGAVPDTS